MAEEKLALYSFGFECGYGALYGLFKAKPSDVKKLIDSKNEVYFGEVNGKHSEVYGPVEEGDVEFITDDENIVSAMPVFGYNPFDYATPENEEEDV